MSNSTIADTALIVMTLTWTFRWIRWWRLRWARTPGLRQNSVNNLPVGLVVVVLLGLLPGAYEDISLRTLVASSVGFAAVILTFFNLAGQCMVLQDVAAAKRPARVTA